MEKENASDEMVEQDVDQSMKTYTSWRFLVGLLTMLIATALHVYVL